MRARLGTLAGLLGAVRGAVGADAALPHRLEPAQRRSSRPRINAIVAVGMTFVIISGGIDLSVGSVLAPVAGVVLASVLHAEVPRAGGARWSRSASASSAGWSTALLITVRAPAAVHRDARDDERGARRRR